MVEVPMLLREKNSDYPSEKAVKNRLRKILRDRGMVVINQWQGPLSENGISDLMCVVPPEAKTLAIELKRPGWKPPGEPPAGEKPGKAYLHFKRQEKFLWKIIKAGGLGYFCSDPEALEQELDRQFGRVGQQSLFGNGNGRPITMSA